jgi:membrane protein insertase Oxa1/YidC/SpoIIIJ
MRQINNHHSTRFLKSFTYGFLQIPQFLTFVWGVRSLCVKNEDLKTGGIFWFENLCESDPLMILPVLSMGMTYLNLQLGVTAENKDWLINRFKGYLQIWVILTLPISANWPSVKVNREFFAIGSRTPSVLSSKHRSCTRRTS